MDNIKKVPEIRFEEFDDEWEEAVLADVANIYDGTHQTPRYKNHGIMFLSVEDIKTLKSSKFISKDDFIKDFNICPERGDVLMTRIGDIGTSNVVDTDKTLAYYVSLALIKPFDISCYYLNYLISSNLFREELNNRTLSTAIPKKINMGEIGKINFYKPINKEQTQVGFFFKNLDEKLELEKEKHEKLINFKKAMLEDIFPKEGEKVPKVRFEGFDDEWEEKELSEILIKYGSGGTPLKSKKEYYDGDIMFLNISDITESKGIIYKTKKTITEDGLTNSAAWIVPKGSISLAMYASVGKVGILGEDMATSQAFFNMILENRYNLYYVYTFLKRAELKSDWVRIIETGSQPNLNASNVKKFIIKIPSPEEQVLIGNFFKNLDEKIEISERKIEKIENFKKAMLDKMFV